MNGITGTAYLSGKLVTSRQFIINSEAYPVFRTKGIAIFSIFLFLLFNFLKLYSQHNIRYSVLYNFTCISDTSDLSYFQPEEYTLLRVGNESRFMPTNQFYNDSILADFEKTHPQPVFKSQEHANKYLDLFTNNVKQKPIRSKYMISKDFNRDKFISILYWSFRRSYMEEDMNLEWKITNEKDTVLGLPCIEAKTNYGGRNYTACFTPEIPINDGPYTFRGLPGLILKVQDDKKWYKFIATGINTNHSERYIREDFVDNQAVKIDRKTFIEKMRERKHNPRFPMGMLKVS